MDYQNNLKPNNNQILASRYLITPQPVWHAIDVSTQPGGTIYSNQACTQSDKLDVNSLLLRGMDLLKDEGKRFASDKSRTGGDTSFMRTILKGGTLTDRVSALTLLVQSSPIHNLIALEQLFNMARKKNRRILVLAMDAIKDLLTGKGLVDTGLLPSDKKLRYMIDSVITQKGKLSDADLVLFAFEDRLKRLYFEFIGVLEHLSHDSLPHIRSRTLCCVFELLVNKPEQELNLLKLLVNKLGDQDRKVATKTCFLINKLLTDHHPQMQLVVVKAVEEFMHRHTCSDRAHYYAIITLNQLVLSHDDDNHANVPAYLIETYFGLFNKFVNDKACIDHKLISALLTGVNRAFPFAKSVLVTDNLVAEQQSTKIKVTTDPVPQSPTLSKHLETLYKVAHHDNFTVQVQALSLIYQIVQQTQPSFMARYYRSLYLSMLSVRTLASTKQLAMFLNLVYRSIKSDVCMDRVQAFMKRLVMLASTDKHPGFAIGCLWIMTTLVQQQNLQSIWTMIRMGEDSGGGKVFDPLARSPEYANASSSCLWDLYTLTRHFHPSVQVFAHALCNGKPLRMPKGVDPLHTFTLSKFLDKFTYKKPKKELVVSLNPTMAGFRSTFLPEADTKTGVLMIVGDGLPVNSSAFLNQSHVAADEVFFHKYFSKLNQIRPLKQLNPVDEMGSDEDEIERAIMQSAKSCEVVLDDSADIDLPEDLVDLELAFANAANLSGDESDQYTQQINFDDDQADGFDSNDDDDTLFRRQKKKNKKADNLGYSISGSVFASAEEFSRMLESKEGLDDDILDTFDDSVPAAGAHNKHGSKKRKSGSKDGGRPQQKKNKKGRK